MTYFHITLFSDNTLTLGVYSGSFIFVFSFLIFKAWSMNNVCTELQLCTDIISKTYLCLMAASDDKLSYINGQCSTGQLIKYLSH